MSDQDQHHLLVPSSIFESPSCICERVPALSSAKSTNAGLFANSYKKKRGEQGKATTHLTYDGMVLSIPEATELHFLKGYAKDLMNPSKHNLYFIEVHKHIEIKKTNNSLAIVNPQKRVLETGEVTTMNLGVNQLSNLAIAPSRLDSLKDGDLIELKIMNFPIDLDYKGPSVVSKEEILRVVKHIQSSCRVFFPKDTPSSTFDVVVTMASPKIVGNCVKTGVHLNFPKLIVTNEMALRMRALIIVDIIEQEGVREGDYNKWDDVIDERIYIGCGLRLFGSGKAEVCKKCDKSNKDEHCEDCQGARRVKDGPDGRRYKILCVVNGQGEEDSNKLDAYLRNTIELVKAVSIRPLACTDKSDICTSGYKIPDGAPIPQGWEINSKGIARPKRSRKGSDGEDVPKTYNGKENPRSRVIHNLIQTSFKRQDGSNPYKNLNVDKVNWVQGGASGGIMYVDVRGRGEGFCHNKCADHNGNRIRFKITPTGIVQTCYSTNTYNNISCDKFASSIRSIDSKSVATLFGIAREKKTNKGESVKSPSSGGGDNLDSIRMALRNRIFGAAKDDKQKKKRKGGGGKEIKATAEAFEKSF